jgi:hypothetical protein
MKGPWFPYFQAPQSFSVAGLTLLCRIADKYLTLLCYIKTVGWKTEKAAPDAKVLIRPIAFCFAI